MKAVWSEFRSGLKHRILVFALLILAAPSVSLASDSGNGLAAGAATLGVHAVQHTFDVIRVGDVRPTQHSDFGGRVELAYAALPWLEVAVSAYRGVSHFDFDTGFERGEGRDSDWSVDIGPNFPLGKVGPARALLGGTFFYGEARSKTTVSRSGIPGSAFTVEAPRTFMIGGAGRLLATVPLVERLEGILQINAGVMQARGHGRPSGHLYWWNGRSFSAALGVRVVLARGRS